MSATRASRVLLTGFEAFGGEKVNPSEMVARALDGKEVEGRTIVAAVLPCVFGSAQAELERLLEEVDPELVICVGQAGDSDAIRVERVAVNIDDASIPDNAGARPIDQPIHIDGPTAYWSTLPLRALVQALGVSGIPAEISPSAGSFVCNHVFYHLMHVLERRPEIRGGFIHIPYLPEQVQGKSRAKSMSLERMIEALRVATKTSLLSELEFGEGL